MNIASPHKRHVKTIVKMMALALCAGISSLTYAQTASLKSASDSEIKHRLLGYWESPRHDYLIKSDGIMYMCPRKYCTTKNTWDVKNNIFFWNSQPNEIVTLTDKKFVYREMQGNHLTYTLVRVTEKLAEAE